MRREFIEFKGRKYFKRKNGYYESKRPCVQLHRDIYEYYYGLIPQGYVIHHIDNNPSNNNIENLQLMLWGEHARQIMINSNPYKASIAKSRKAVINLTTNEIFISIAEASRKYGIKDSSIGCVCRGTRKTAGGFKWNYREEEIC